MTVSDEDWDKVAPSFRVSHMMRDDAERENVVAAYHAGLAAADRSAVEARGFLRALVMSMRDTSDDEMRVAWGNEALAVIDQLGGR